MAPHFLKSRFITSCH